MFTKCKFSFISFPYFQPLLSKSLTLPQAFPLSLLHPLYPFSFPLFSYYTRITPISLLLFTTLSLSLFTPRPPIHETFCIHLPTTLKPLPPYYPNTLPLPFSYHKITYIFLPNPLYPLTVCHPPCYHKTNPISLPLNSTLLLSLYIPLNLSYFPTPPLDSLTLHLSSYYPRVPLLL